MAEPSAAVALPGLEWRSRDGFYLLISSAFISVLSLALPLTLMQVFDRILGNQATDTLAWLIGGCLLALLLEFGLTLGRAAISGSMAARFEHLAGCQAINAILGCRLDQFAREGLGAHLDRLSAIGALRGFYSGQAFQAALDLPFALLLLVVTAMLGGRLVLVPLATALALVGVVLYCDARFRVARQQRLRSNDQRSSFALEVLSRIHAAKAISMEEPLLRRHERLQADSTVADLEASEWTALPNHLGAFFSQVAVFGVIGLGASQVSDGVLTLGTLTACSLLSARVMQPIQSLSGFLLRRSEARVARQRYGEIVALEPEVKPGLPPVPEDIAGGLELSGVCFRYAPGYPQVISDLSLVVPAKTMVAIDGAPSAGTTTLLRLLMGALTPQQGHVLIDGYNLAGWDPTSLRGRVEYLPPAGTLFKGTLLENIALFHPLRHEAALDAAALVGLDELVAALPQGYETPVTAQSNSLLPSGLIQRIAIARALVVRPRLLLLDKTEAAMDADSQRVLRWLLERLHGTCTVVMVTATPSLQALADQSFVLHQGQLTPRAATAVTAAVHRPAGSSRG